MLSTLRNAWKIPELRKRILYTIFLVMVLRMGNFIPVPGVNIAALSASMGQSGTLINFYDLISGGAFSGFSIFALAVSPYINASIIMQLLTIAIPKLEQLSKEGEDGRKKIQNITRYISIPISIIIAYASYMYIYNQGVVTDSSFLGVMLILVPLIAGSTFLMWLGDQITVKGIGNGLSLIIFVNIISRFPTLVNQIIKSQETGAVTGVAVAMLLVVSLAILLSIIYMTLAERRIHVQYAGKAVGNKTYKGQTTHIPISIIGSAVIAIIFAMSVLQFVPVITQLFFSKTSFYAFINSNSPWNIFSTNTWSHAVVYAILVIFFTWFYSQITFKPEEMAENMHKSAGFIPGIRPGKQTELYLEKILNKVSVIGGIYASIIALFPIIISAHTPFKGIQFGGTMFLIMVSVSLETVRQIESQLVMRHYQGFLK